MIFYHFTCYEHIEAIRREGLTRGEIPFSATEVGNAIWLTTDPDPSGHGLSSGEEVSPEICRRLRMPEGTRWANKRAIRIKVRWPMAKATPWLSWARKRLEPVWLNTLTRSGGGSRKAKTWYLSFDPIPPSALAVIDYLETQDATARASRH